MVQNGDLNRSGIVISSRRFFAGGAAIAALVTSVAIALALTGAGDTTADLVLGQPSFTSSTANNGGVSASTFDEPAGMAVDSSGRIYVADVRNARILVFNNLTDTLADKVLGQPAFASSTWNNGGVSSTSLDRPYGVDIDTNGRVYVADFANHRILIFNNLADTTADMVLGQPNFTSNADNNGGRSATTFADPSNIAIDSSGRLYVTDATNNRVLIFNNLADTVADMVLGQPNFNVDTANNGGISASSLSNPWGIAIDSSGRVYVGDYNNHRVLVFNNLADTVADRVLGQPSFSVATANNGGITATSLNNPWGVELDVNGRLYVADATNNRVLVFNNLADTVADRVLGQPGFTSDTANNGGITATSLNVPVGILPGANGQVLVSDQSNHRILVFSDPFATAAATVPVAGIVASTDTTVTVILPLATTESFVQINLPQIASITSGVLKNASDSVGTNASYTCTTSLLNTGDSLTIPIWTNQGTGRLFLGIRSDTASLKSNGLPGGISSDDTGRQAFGATVVLTEFSDSTGRLLGDSKTTTNIGDSFSYTLRYFLSERTVKLYRALGFDTAPGSKSFGFYYADTYGGNWVEDRTVTVSVVAASAPHALEIRVSGIAKDLPGGLGGASGSTSSASNGRCVLNSLFGNTQLDRLFPVMRGVRDTILGSSIGRLFVGGYYSFAIVLFGFLGMVVGGKAITK